MAGLTGRYKRRLFIAALTLLLVGGVWLNNQDRSLVHLPSNSHSNGAPAPIKIIIDQAGIYRLSADELQEMGLDIATLSPGRLRLTNLGREVSFWLDGTGDAAKLTFYGEASRSKYSASNVYWLEVDGSALSSAVETLPEQESNELALQVGNGAYLETERLEQNQLYLPTADGSERWFWMSLVAPGDFSYDLELDSIVPGPARLRVAIWASTESGENPDHHLRMAINGTGIHEEQWDGKGFKTVEAIFSTTALREGVNRITLQSPGDTGAAVDILYLDWLELSFSRAPVARQSRLEITCAQSPIQPMGFDSPLQVYDITLPQRAQRVGENIEPTHPIDCQPGRRYLIVGENAGLSPRKLLESQQLPDLRAVNAAADYLAIGPADLLKPLQPLLELRAAQGLKTLSVPIEAVYDQFNYGMPEPQALRALLEYASRHWNPAPRYLLLVGDASYDPKGYLAAPEANRLTVELVDTQYGGETVSDTGALQSEQQAARMPAIGLLPARDAEQVKGYVQKVLKYEASLAGRNQNTRLLAVADGQDMSFRLDAQSFLDEFPSSQYEVELFAPDAGAGDATAQLRQRLAEEYHLVAYFGHGSLQMWGKDRLLSVEDIARLPDTASLPIVLHFTCLTGYYIHPSVESLAETMLWQPNGGTVAVLAPSSLTLPYDQSFLSLPLARLLVTEPELTIGELHLKARQQVPLNSQGAADVMRTFMLFGDPALRVSANSP